MQTASSRVWTLVAKFTSYDNNTPWAPQCFWLCVCVCIYIYIYSVCVLSQQNFWEAHFIKDDSQGLRVEFFIFLFTTKMS